jgi:hypothetical protein
MRSKRLAGLGAAIAGVTLIAGTAFGQLPTFATFSGTGTSAANVIIPQKPTSQVRVVSLIAQSDLASSAINIYSGTTARSIAQATTNIASTILILDATNGLASSALLYVQGATSNVVATLSSWTQTNIWSGVGTITNTLGYVVLTGALGIPQTVNMEVEVLGNQVTLGQGATTNRVYASDGLYVANYGRAAYVTVNGTSNCGLQSVTVHYDAQSQ